MLAFTLVLAPDAGAVPPQVAARVPSLIEVEGNPYGTGSGPTYGRMVPRDLTPEEMQGAVQFHLELNLQNADELQAHIDRGDILKPAELERYLPTAATYAALRDWLVSQGFAITLESNLRHTLFASGTVAQAAAAFQTRFGRVATKDGEFTSALTEPTLPADLAPSVRTIGGLQPHLRRHHSTATLAPMAVPQGYLSPTLVAAYYGAPAGLNGSGQTIAVICDNAPLTSDLVQFWSTCGIPQSAGNFTVVNIQGGPGSSTADQSEASMDVEWASAMASGAAIRLYATPYPLFSNTETAAYTQILNDLPSCPGIHQVSESFGGPEGTSSGSLALLAAQGVSCFSCSGDFGSNPDYTTDTYDSASPPDVEYPAGDPNVTGVGGTVLRFDINGKIMAPEVAWSLSGSDKFASGGGVSTFVPRPSWQAGTGVPAGTMRCVPDVSAIAMNSIPNETGGLAPLMVINGKDGAYGGTSLACPIWAGLCALINQSLADAGLKPTGNLNSKIYPLIGTNAFTDITSGSNGAHSAGVGYDMVTGIGSPNLANLIAGLEAGPPGLSVSVPSKLPQDAVANGSAEITLTALAAGGPTGFQWYLNGTAIAGATSSTLAVSQDAANQGIYSVTVTNANGSTSAPAGILNVSTNAWIINLSARAYAETGANVLIAGFVTTGPDKKSVLVRGDGPALAAFQIANFLPDPTLTLVSGTTTVATTASWSTSLDPAFARLGAFGLTAGSHDTALLESLAPGSYTAQIVSQTTNSGVALAEIYDADGDAPADRLVNISARAFVGTGSNILIGGFVIGGSTAQTVIIRGDGPSLAGFGVSGPLASTTLILSNTNGTIATNTGWSNAPVAGSAASGSIVVQPLTADLSAKVGAFALAADSNDSAIVATLPPGAYTAQLAGANNATGVALVEIYELR